MSTICRSLLARNHDILYDTILKKGGGKGGKRGKFGLENCVKAEFNRFIALFVSRFSRSIRSLTEIFILGEDIIFVSFFETRTWRNRVERREK